MKINKRELAHYIIGATILYYTMSIIIGFAQQTASGEIGIAVVSISVSTLWYIIFDQVLHVIVKGEKISIVKR